MRSSIHGSLQGVDVIGEIAGGSQGGISLICSARPAGLTRGIKCNVLWIIIRMPKYGAGRGVENTLFMHIDFRVQKSR